MWKQEKRRTQEILSKHWESFLHSVGDWAQAQIAQRGWEIFKSCLDVILGTLFWMFLLEYRLEQMDPEIPGSLLLWFYYVLYTHCLLVHIPLLIFFLIIHRIRWKEYYVSNRSETHSTDSSNIFIIAVTMIIAITIAISIAITINSIKVDTTTKPLWKVILNNHYIYCKCAFHFFWILTLKYIYIVSESFLHLPLAPSWALFDLIICLCMTSQSVAMERAVISNK